MFNPETLDLTSLPWLPMEQKSTLPPIPGIYLAIDSSGVVQYVGRSTNIRTRWAGHHRHDQLKTMGGVRIAYIGLNDVELLADVEVALIKHFQPLLNRIPGKTGLPPLQKLPQPGKKRRSRKVKDTVGMTYRMLPEVKNAVAEIANLTARSENLQMEVFVKVGYLHAKGINIYGMTEGQIAMKFAELIDSDD